MKETIENIISKTNARTMIFENLSLLKLTVGTTGPRGGDSSKGGRTILQFENEGASDMRISLDGKEIDHWDRISIVFGGDSELENLVASLKFALQVLDDSSQTLSYRERQEENFYNYLNELMAHYASKGTLKGMTDYRNKYGVVGITKEQFFEFKLHQYSSIDRKLSSEIYKYIKNQKNKKK